MPQIFETFIYPFLGTITGGIVVFCIQKKYQKILEREKLISVINSTIFRLNIIKKDIKYIKNCMDGVKTIEQISIKNFEREEKNNTLRYYMEESSFMLSHLKIYDIIKKNEDHMIFNKDREHPLLEEINTYIHNHKILFFFVKRRNKHVREILNLIFERKSKFFNRGIIDFNKENIDFLKNKFVYHEIEKLDKNINDLIEKMPSSIELIFEKIEKIIKNKKIQKEKLLEINRETAYHLDQNVRGKMSNCSKFKKNLQKNNLDSYNSEAILPLALIEFTGFSLREIFNKISIDRSILDKDVINADDVKKNLEDQLEKKIPKECISNRLKDQLNHLKNKLIFSLEKFNIPYITECQKILEDIYPTIINQLSWDRFSQGKWKSNEVIPMELRQKIIKLIVSENLYALRFLSIYKENFLLKKYSNEPLYKIINKIKIKEKMDAGDCELIHVAINGQSSPSNREKRIIDCYTMDNSNEIKRRVIFCILFYELLEHNLNNPPVNIPESYRFYNRDYKFDKSYFGKIYILNAKGLVQEKIDIKEFTSEKVIEKIKKNDPEFNSIID